MHVNPTSRDYSISRFPFLVFPLDEFHGPWRCVVASAAAAAYTRSSNARIASPFAFVANSQQVRGMMPIFRYSSGLPVVLLGVLAWFVVAPRACASCGDYVSYRSKAAVEGHTAKRSHASLPSGPAQPCHGPRCSRPTAPPMTPAPAPPNVLPQWGCLNPPCTPVLHGSDLFAGDTRVARPTGSPTTIFHPPRG